MMIEQTLKGGLKVAAAALALTLMQGTAAQAVPATNGMRVQPLSAQEFEVQFFAGRANTEYWCAAGEYARRILPNDPTQRIWRISPPSRGQGEGIRFSVVPPPGGASQGGATLLSLGGPQDGSMTLAVAQTYCEVNRFRRRS